MSYSANMVNLYFHFKMNCEVVDSGWIYTTGSGETKTLHHSVTSKMGRKASKMVTHPTPWCLIWFFSSRAYFSISEKVRSKHLQIQWTVSKLQKLCNLCNIFRFLLYPFVFHLIIANTTGKYYLHIENSYKIGTLIVPKTHWPKHTPHRWNGPKMQSRLLRAQLLVRNCE